MEKFSGLSRLSFKKDVFAAKSAKWIKIVFRALILLSIGYVMLYPILYIVSGAFKSEIDIYDPTVAWLPKHYSFVPMKLALDAISFWGSLSRTLQILIPSVLFQMVSTVFTAYGFSRFRFRGKNVLFAFLLFTIIVPMQTIEIPLYINFSHFNFFGIGAIFGFNVNLIDKNAIFYIMAIFGMGIRSGLYILILIQFFKNMPKELDEAAMIDGCGPFDTFLKVMIPNVMSPIVTIMVFSIVWYWNDYYCASMFLSNNLTLTVNLTMLNNMLSITSQSSMPGITSTQLWIMRSSVLECGCLLVVAPLIIMYIFAQKFFTESIERTGIIG